VTDVKLAEPDHVLPSYSAPEQLCGSMSLQSSTSTSSRKIYLVCSSKSHAQNPL